jgi:hypothetical protein
VLEGNPYIINKSQNASPIFQGYLVTSRTVTPRCRKLLMSRATRRKTPIASPRSLQRILAHTHTHILQILADKTAPCQRTVRSCQAAAPTAVLNRHILSTFLQDMGLRLSVCRLKQDRQCTYNVFRRVRATIVAVEKQ